MIKAGIKEALQSGQLNSWWWISQPLDLFVFCGSSLSPPSTTPLSPPTPPISPTLTIQSPNPSSPSCPCAPHTIPRLSPQCHCPRGLPLPPVQGPPARGKRTGTAEDTGHLVKQWKNEKRQNNGGLRRAFVTLAPGPLCRRWEGAIQLLEYQMVRMLCRFDINLIPAMAHIWRH